MSNLRKKLEHARDAYERVRYPGDLADDIFARLDAGEKLDEGADGNDSAMRIGPGPAAPSRGARWRPLLAIAAAVAVIATTAFTLRYAGREGATVEIANDIPAVPTTPNDEVAAKPADAAEVAAVEAADFSVVPSYQSFAISVPTSISLASLEEYEQQARERQQTSSEAGSTVQ